MFFSSEHLRPYCCKLCLFFSFKAVKCPPLSSPKNGQMSGANCHGSYQAKCFFDCATGYLRYGPPFRECLANKQWSGQQVRCDGKIMPYNKLY